MSAEQEIQVVKEISQQERDQRDNRTLLKEAGQRAIESGNLDSVLGSNGRSGRLATGNFTRLADVTGLSRVHIGKVLRGKVEPSLKTLRRISEATGLSIDGISEYIQNQKEKEKST